MQFEGSLPGGVLAGWSSLLLTASCCSAPGVTAPGDPEDSCLCVAFGGRFPLHAPACHDSLETGAVFLCSRDRLDDDRGNKVRPRWRWAGLFLGTGVCASPGVCVRCGCCWSGGGRGRVPVGSGHSGGPCLRWRHLLCPVGGRGPGQGCGWVASTALSEGNRMQAGTRSEASNFFGGRGCQRGPLLGSHRPWSLDLRLLPTLWSWVLPSTRLSEATPTLVCPPTCPLPSILPQ